MAFPVAAAILGGASLGSGIFGSIFNSNSQKKANKAQMDFQKEMYERQRADSLADWQMEADYNSPKAQMQRLKDANLNPNLVYGHGADAQMGSVRSSSPGSYSPTAPELDLGFVPQSLGMIYDIQLKDAQKDNLQAARAVQEQDVLLKAAQIQNTLQDVHTKEFDLKMKNDLKAINVDMAEQALTKARADADKAWSDADVADETKKDRIDQAKSEAIKALNEAGASNHLEKRVLQELDNLKNTGSLQKFEIALNKLGITKGDNVFLRIFTKLFGKFIPTP